MPAVGSEVVSRNVVPGPMNRLLPSALPSGFRIDRSANGKVAFVTFTLIRWPAVPPSVTRAFCPGALVEIDTGEPPGVALADASGGTS